MIGVRVIKPDDIQILLAAFALDADEFPGIDVIAVVGRVRARIAAARNAYDGFRAIVVKAPEQHATALIGIGFFSMLPKGKVVGLSDFEHRLRSEVRSRSEVRLKR